MTSTDSSLSSTDEGCSSPSEIGASAPFPWHPVEIATGLIFGVVDDPTALPRVDADITIRSVLEDIVRRAFERGPVAVSFSGGRDSSVVLAVAQHVARQGGFAAPLPVTLAYPGIESADETGGRTSCSDISESRSGSSSRSRANSTY